MEMSGPSPATGQSLVEYALIVSMIELVAIAALALFGTQIDAILSTIASNIDG
jgi:Flp pilus assembly pilin Flp